MPQGLLALDLATVTGYAYLKSLENTPISGTCRIISVDKSSVGYFIAFEKFIDDLITLSDPHTIVFEAPFIGAIRNLNTVRRLTGFTLLTEMAAYKKSIPRIREVNNSSVKKFFTGNGRADKKDMIFKCRSKGWDPKDDNEADALAILCLGVSIIYGVEI